jgi:hypothetical protein
MSGEGPRDLLGRRILADALAAELFDHAVGPKDVDPGPTVVTIEGPWGSGKSTLMDLVREGLPTPAQAPVAPRRLTVRAASRLLRHGSGREPARPPNTATRGVVTAWFNPWAHQSGEQVWAGLVAEIIQAAEPVLYPTERARQWYWFTRNLSRIDRYALHRALHRRILSPLLTLGALGVVASLGIAVAELETAATVAGQRLSTAVLALVLSTTFLSVGALHTVWRYLRGQAARFLPGEIFHGPVTSTAAPDGQSGGAGPAEGLADPLRRARAGSLYLHQHDVSELVADLDEAGYELIVFVDDLDRCRALTTAEVFEAINVFLAGFVAERRGTGRENPGDPGSSLRARFVIGLDPVVVAGHLDRVFADLYDPKNRPDLDDPGPGWAFLRKLVHLPVSVPQVSDGSMFHYLDELTGQAAPAPPAPARAESVPRQADSVPLRELVGHPEVRLLVRERVAAQDDRSVRQTMRLVNVWRLYERVLAVAEPLGDVGAAVARTRRLIVVAEIVTRWPALQRYLHRRTGDRTRLQELAAVAADPTRWQQLVAGVTNNAPGTAAALEALRELLCAHDGPAVATLAAKVL